jgi:hypothetical protein
VKLEVKETDARRPYGWRSRAIFALLALGILLAFAASIWRSNRQATWPEVKGRPTATRIVRWAGSPYFPHTMYAGQCSIDYVVQGKHYSTWANSEYMDQDARFISDRMNTCPSTHFAVHYNPKDPSDAVAERLD